LKQYTEDLSNSISRLLCLVPENLMIDSLGAECWWSSIWVASEVRVFTSRYFVILPRKPPEQQTLKPIDMHEVSVEESFIFMHVRLKCNLLTQANWATDGRI
jgi:hypothetical protein